MQRFIENWEAITGGSPEKGYAFENWQFKNTQECNVVQ
jgi:hypothetical protein